MFLAGCAGSVAVVHIHPPERFTTVTDTIHAVDADRELKARHRAMWALGDYPAVATTVIPELGPILVEASGVRAGQTVLDVGAGSGNAAIPAALAGADVVASDLTPELLDTGRMLAAEAGAELEWRVADAEALPFGEGDFDAVLSCVGVMFAPHHQASADELVRVTRPGGTIGLLNWTPAGFIGQMFATMKPYAPVPPPGAQPAPLWGDEEHVRGLLGDRVTDVTAVRRTVRVDRFATPADFREFFKACYGPTIATYRSIAADPGKVAALDADLADLALRHHTGGPGLAMDWEYLLLTARRAA
jgi:SAM-dependent methyltransferase